MRVSDRGTVAGHSGVGQGSTYSDSLIRYKASKLMLVSIAARWTRESGLVGESRRRLTFFFLLLSSTGMSAAAVAAAAAAIAAFSAFDLRPRFLGSLGATGAAGAIPCSCS